MPARFILVGVILSAMMLSSADAVDGPVVDMKALADAGVKTMEKLGVTPVSWHVSNTLQNGVEIRVSMLRAGGRQRAVVWIVHDGQRSEVFRVIMRDALWYVTDRLGPRKYRPYEAPADLPAIYIALGRAELRVVGSSTMPADAKLEGVTDDVVTFRQPLVPEVARLLRSTVDQVDAMARQTGHAVPPELQRNMDFCRDLLAHGLPIRVSLSTGLVLEFGTQKFHTRVTNVRFLDQVDEREFDVDTQKWADYSDDPTAGNLNDLVMIGHQPGMGPDAKDFDFDGRFLDVKTGRFRRIPYPGGLVWPGCFLQDRRFAIVLGMDDDGSFRPFRIDLKTRDCSPFGGPPVDAGFNLSAELSPDGKTVLMAHLDPEAGPLQSQLCLIDVATGAVKTLGKPLDTAFLGWAADGRHVILLHRDYKDLHSPAITSIASMDMEGRVTVLRRGNFPVVLADRQTILFQDPQTQLWHTCDLKGENDKLFADGLKGYSFPTPAPDGKRLLMMHIAPPNAPEPVVLEIGQTQGYVVPHGDGLWGIPAWR